MRKFRESNMQKFREKIMRKFQKFLVIVERMEEKLLI